MRIALCFSGQLRNVGSTYGSWRSNVLEPNAGHQIDVFGHSWFDNDTIGSVYYAANKEPTAFPASAPIPENVIQQVYDCYNPVKLVLERPQTFNADKYNERKLEDAVPQHGISRLYSLYQANRLKREYELQHKFRYDVVMCARYDFIIKEPLLFRRAPTRGIAHLGYSPHGFNVCHAMGDTESIDAYADLWFHYDAVYNSGATWADELIALKYLEGINMPIYDVSIPNGLNRG